MKIILTSFFLMMTLNFINGQTSSPKCDSTCTNESGNNLLINGDFESGNTGFSASPYTYYTSSPMIQGEYCVTSNPGSIHFGFAGVDHTTGTGKMMVVNGSDTYKGKFYSQTIQVNPNTCYKVSAWLNNIASSQYTGLAEAYIRFNLNGNNNYPAVQGTQFPDQWIPMNTFWYSDTCTVLTYMLEDTSSAGNGNDFAIDDLSVVKLNCETSNGITVSKPLDNIFSIFPNPSSGIYNIRVNSTILDNFNINVYDVLGKNVYQESFTNSNIQSIPVDLRKLTNGIYIIAISSANEQYSFKIVKE